MNLQLVIFDVDGLMIDSERIWSEAFEKAGKVLGIPVSGKDIFCEVVGKSGEDSKRIIEKYLHEDTETFRSMAHEIGFHELSQHIPVKPGLYELLDTLEELQIPKAVATSTVYELTKQRLDRIGVYDRFDFVICGDEVMHKKPNPEIYNRIIEHFQIDSQSALVLEDSYYGVEAAHNANIPCIMVPDLLEPTEIQKQTATAIMKDLNEVKQYIESIKK